MATAVEVLGGLALIAGAFIPLATALLVIEMLVAMFRRALSVAVAPQ